jgi:hypothetical protein
MLVLFSSVNRRRLRLSSRLNIPLTAQGIRRNNGHRQQELAHDFVFDRNKKPRQFLIWKSSCCSGHKLRQLGFHVNELNQLTSHLMHTNVSRVWHHAAAGAWWPVVNQLHKTAGKLQTCACQSFIKQRSKPCALLRRLIGILGVLVSQRCELLVRVQSNRV